MGERVHLRAESTGDTHLGERNGEAAFADVVTGHDEPGPHRGVQVTIGLGRVGIWRWNDTSVSWGSLEQVEVRPRSVDAFMQIMGRSAALLGTVTADSMLSIPGVEPIPVSHLADAFNSTGAR